MDLTTAITPWQPFYIAAAGASSVLLGLVFVAISLHYDPRNLDRYLVGMTTEAAVPFFYAAIVSLIMLVPPALPWFPTIALLVVGVLAALNSSIPLAGRWFRAPAASRPRSPGQRVKLALSFVTAVAVVPVALALPGAPNVALYLVGAIVLAFVAFGMQNAWDAVLRRDLRVDAIADEPAGAVAEAPRGM
jgi:hypothetical protein